MAISRFGLATLACILTLTQAGLLDTAVKGTTTDYAKFFQDSFSSVKDLVPSSQSELVLNANRVKDLLLAVNSKKALLGALAGTDQKNTLNMAGSLLREVSGFSSKVSRDGEARFNQNKSMWDSLLNKVFNTAGLLKLLPLLTKASPQAPIVSAILAPIVLAIYRF
ncbi:unnamed protein product, partial [Mesorhabditis belari]|uniref:Uncharacterized protein n=1 Tax=Mesorhabditis belari TaxID=2138241 RepID=A0AAF3J9T8_9BILA